MIFSLQLNGDHVVSRGGEPERVFDRALPFDVLDRQEAKEGNIWKYILRAPGVEGTFSLGSLISEDDRGLRHDIPVATGAGCQLSCVMCEIPYSPRPFERVLTADEMEYQVRLAVTERRAEDARQMRLVVGFLGDGEPFANYKNVVTVADRILTDTNLNVDRCRISTTGIQPKLISALADTTFGRSCRGRVQYSLMSVIPDRRKALIPQGQSLERCLPHCDEYAERTGQATDFNVAPIEGMNDSDEEAMLLGRLVADKHKIRRIRLADFNPIPDRPDLRPSPPEVVARFEGIIRGMGVPVHRFKGVVDSQVMVGCGQMRARMEGYLTSGIQIDVPGRGTERVE